jgi:hypothetical protein
VPILVAECWASCKLMDRCVKTKSCVLLSCTPVLLVSWHRNGNWDSLRSDRSRCNHWHDCKRRSTHYEHLKLSQMEPKTTAAEAQIVSPRQKCTACAIAASPIRFHVRSSPYKHITPSPLALGAPTVRTCYAFKVPPSKHPGCHATR